MIPGRQLRVAAAPSLLALALVGCASTDTTSAGAVAAAARATSAAPSTATAPPSPGPQSLDATAADPEGAAGSVTVFLSDGQSCQARTPVRHRAPQGEPAARAAAALLRGPTDDERALGLDFFGSPEVPLLRAVTVRAETAYVDLTRAFLSVNNVSTACGSELFRSGVENTLRQLPGLTDVRYAVEGSPSAFYEHMQLACPAVAAESEHCDPAPFR